jgi:hypothetical protein
LKTLNPDHQKDEIKKYTLNDAKEKANKSLEFNMQERQMMEKLDDMIRNKDKTKGTGTGVRVD